MDEFDSGYRSPSPAQRSRNTRRAYASDWDDFAGWCQEHGFQSLPSAHETVALYISALDENGKRLSTIRRRLAAIGAVHRSAGYQSPAGSAAVTGALETITRTQQLEPASKAPIFPSELRRIVRNLPDSLLGIRDRSLLLLGYAGELGRAELVGLNLEDLTASGQRLRVRVSPSAESGRAAGSAQELEIEPGEDPALCPVRATQQWIERLAADASRSGEGQQENHDELFAPAAVPQPLGPRPLFRPINRHGQIGSGRLSERSVATIIKRAAGAAGLDAERYSGLSLRQGARLARLIEG